MTGELALCNGHNLDGGSVKGGVGGAVDTEPPEEGFARHAGEPWKWDAEPWRSLNEGRVSISGSVGFHSALS